MKAWLLKTGPADWKYMSLGRILTLPPDLRTTGRRITYDPLTNNGTHPIAVPSPVGRERGIVLRPREREKVAAGRMRVVGVKTDPVVRVRFSKIGGQCQDAPKSLGN